ncbi:MAG: response regulator transcription factor [Bacteroidetes bacterium]|nr:response regulator transcription factor [Bacteroidota bacterium]
MANILVVEDEVNVSSFIKKGLEEKGHNIDVAFDGAMGLSLACSREYDVIILDVILPQMNGLEMCRRYRGNMGYAVPVIMLTALGTTDDVVNGLEIGADDYLTKPFMFDELIARINVVLRRKGMGYTAKIYEFADLTLNTETMIVTRSGKNISLTTKEFRLLELLMANQLRVLSRTHIIENVWDANIDMNTNVVEVYINYLRNKVDKGFQVKLIHTVIGMGYVLKEE